MGLRRGQSKLICDPLPHGRLHRFQLGRRRAWDAGEEVVGVFYPGDAFGFGSVDEEGFEDAARAELVVVAGDEELGGAAGGEEVVGVVAAGGADGEAEAYEALDAGVAATGAEAHVGAEREAGEEDGETEAAVKPVECGANVVDFADAFVVYAFAQARAAEVEAQDRKSEVGERFRRVIDGLGVHGAAAGRVRVGYNRGVQSVFAAGVEQCFETASRATKVFDGLDV